MAQTIPAAIPISMYSNVQTGPKIQFGGLKLGLFSDTYQSLTEDWVAKPDKKPMIRQMATEMAI